MQKFKRHSVAQQRARIRQYYWLKENKSLKQTQEQAMKNKLIDLNDHLFAQLERLSDEDIKGDELKEEIERAKSVSNVSKVIVNNAKLALDAEKFKTEYQNPTLPKMIEG